MTSALRRVPAEMGLAAAGVERLEFETGPVSTSRALSKVLEAA